MLKMQCGCGHKIAVPDTFGGKRIKCPRCQGPLQVPGAAAAAVAPSRGPAPRGRAPAVATRPAPPARPVLAAAPSQTPTNNDIRHARMKRKALENKRKSHNMTVALIAGGMVVIGLAALLIVGMNNRPVAAPVAQKDAQDKKPTETADASPLDKLRNRRERAKTDTSGDSTAASPASLAITTTSTFDANAGTTTLQSQPSPFSVAGKSMTLTVKLVYDGKDLKNATQMTALLRVKGDFTDLVSGANTDEPQLSFEIDGKEYDHKPTTQFGGDERKGENDRELLPTEVEYILDRTTLLALARGSNMKMKMGVMDFGFSEDQMALFRSFDPSPKPADPQPAAPEEKPSEENAATEKPAVNADDERDEKEMEMKKK